MHIPVSTSILPPDPEFLANLEDSDFDEDKIEATIAAYNKSRGITPSIKNNKYNEQPAGRRPAMVQWYDPNFYPFAVMAWGRAGNTLESFATNCYINYVNRLKDWRKEWPEFDEACTLAMHWREFYWEQRLKYANDPVQLKKAIQATRNFVSDRWRVAEVELAKNRLTAKLTINQQNYGLNAQELAEKMSVDQLMKLMDLSERQMAREIQLKPDEYKILKDEESKATKV